MLTVFEAPWKLNGQHWEAPVTMITEGVHAGSAGPVYWAPHILERHAHLWRNIPLTLGHPQVGGRPVSIHHSAEITAEYLIGQVVRSWYDRSRKAIRGTVRIRASHPKAREIMRLKEVSVGVFTEDTETYGVWNGEEYELCAISMTPDHLSILPEDQRGACSFQDGCGIRTNARALQTLQRINPNFKGETTMSKNYELEANYPPEVYVATEKQNELQLLAQWEHFDGPIPPEILELQMKHSGQLGNQGGQGYESEANYPPEVKI